MPGKSARNIKIVGAVPVKKSSSTVNGAFRRTDSKIASFKKSASSTSGGATQSR